MLEPLDPAMTMFLKALKWFKLDRAVRPVFPRASFNTLFTCHREELDRRRETETEPEPDTETETEIKLDMDFIDETRNF